MTTVRTDNDNTRIYNTFSNVGRYETSSHLVHLAN